jgi:hypothetical protein
MSSVERIPELPALLARLASSMTTPLLLRRPQGALKTRSGVASESARTTQAPHFVHDEPHAPIGPNGTRLPETRRGVQAQRLAPRRRLLAIDRALSLAAGLPVEEAHFDLDFLVSDIRELASQVVEAQLIAPVQTFLLATVHRLQSDLQPRMVAYARVAHNISSEAGGYSHPAQLSTYVQKQTSYARSLAGRLLPAAALPMPTAAITSFARPAGALATVPTTSHRSQGDRPAADWPSAEILSPTYPLAHAPLQFAHETGRAFDGVATYPQQARQAMAGASPLTSSTIDLQGRSTVKTMALPSIATLEQGIKKKFESTLALQKVAAGTSPTGMGASPVKPEHGANLTSSEKGAEANDVHLLANEVWIQLKRRLRIEAERLGPRQ